jgi:hypothetical protein
MVNKSPVLINAENLKKHHGATGHCFPLRITGTLIEWDGVFPCGHYRLFKYSLHRKICWRNT